MFIEHIFLPEIRNQHYSEILAKFLEQKKIFEILFDQTKEHEQLLNLSNQKFDQRFYLKLSLSKGMFPILVSGFGNCLYNSISMIW